MQRPSRSKALRCVPMAHELGIDFRAEFHGHGRPLHKDQAENEVPQPQDFVACGFTNTKPCCMSVS